MPAGDAFCFIPAASRRLERKNLRTLQGRELLYYAIRAAQESGLFALDAIVVSTESPEVRAVAEKYGARVPFLRDEKLAHDPYGVSDVLADFLRRAPDYARLKRVAIVLPTSPLVNGADVAECHRLLVESGEACAMSVCETEDNALQCVTIQDGVLHYPFPEHMSSPSTLLPKTYRMNAAVTVMDTAAFLRTGTWHMDRVVPYVMPRERAVDVDTEHDLALAEFLMERRR
jgi:CMP-N-acetylneuraminic acid synthetase